jgi:hypothetical protein
LSSSSSLLTSSLTSSLDSKSAGSSANSTLICVSSCQSHSVGTSRWFTWRWRHFWGHCRCRLWCYRCLDCWSALWRFS